MGLLAAFVLGRQIPKVQMSATAGRTESNDTFMRHLKSAILQCLGELADNIHLKSTGRFSIISLLP